MYKKSILSTKKYKPWTRKIQIIIQKIKICKQQQKKKQVIDLKTVYHRPKKIQISCQKIQFIEEKIPAVDKKYHLMKTISIVASPAPRSTAIRKTVLESLILWLSSIWYNLARTLFYLYKKMALWPASVTQRLSDCIENYFGFLAPIADQTTKLIFLISKFFSDLAWFVQNIFFTCIRSWLRDRGYPTILETVLDSWSSCSAY